MGLPLAQVLWNWGAQSLIPGGVWLKWGQLQEALNPSWKQAGIQPKVAHRLKLSQHCRKVLRQQLEVPINTARQFHWHGLNSGLLQYGLELSDKTAAAFSVEPRYPFCDRRLMEFCLAIPADQKFFQGWSRLVARRAMTGILPPDLQTRTSKANLGVSFKANVLKYEQQQVRNLMDAAQPDARLITRYLKPSTLTPACQTWLAQPQAEAPAMTVYTAMTLARWLQSQPL
jgi:asparagine synthase (glutamine-hydrolysing)